MNRNKDLKTTDIEQISHIIKQVQSENELNYFFKELLTQSEICTLSKRWQILKRLLSGHTQRQIAKDLKVSLCKVTRGSKIIQDKNSVLTKCLIKEIQNEG